MRVDIPLPESHDPPQPAHPGRPVHAGVSSRIGDRHTGEDDPDRVPQAVLRALHKIENRVLYRTGAMALPIPVWNLFDHPLMFSALVPARHPDGLLEG